MAEKKHEIEDFSHRWLPISLSRQTSSLVPGPGSLKETKMFLPHPRVKVSIVGSLRDREVACSASDRQGSNFESCVRRTVSSQSSHHPQEILLAQFSLYVHIGALKPDSFHFHFHNYEILKLDTINQVDNRTGWLESVTLGPTARPYTSHAQLICYKQH